jgi:hypothetical protein
MTRERLIDIVTVLTAFFAFLSGLAGFMSSRCVTRAMMAKNESILHQATINDHWAHYQSQHIREDIAHLTKALLATKHKLHQSEYENINQIGKFQSQMKTLSHDAREHETIKAKEDKKCNFYYDISREFASAFILIQIAVVLAPITLITKKQSLLAAGSLIGGIGTIYFLISFIRFFTNVGQF